MKIKLLITITLTLIGLSGLAQKSLKKGDYVDQNMSLGKIVNYKSESALFSDFKGKLLILDFWATWCPSCVAALPKFEQLQKKIGDKLFILPINPFTRNDETLEKICKYFTYKKLKIPSVVEDRILSITFPHRLLPHEVWISEDGKVLATTDDDEVTEENILRYLDTGKLVVKEKIDNMNFVSGQVIDAKTRGNSRALFMSTISKSKDDEGEASYDYYSNSIGHPVMQKSIVFKGATIFHLYSLVLSMFQDNTTELNPTRFVVETKNVSSIPLTIWNDIFYSEDFGTKWLTERYNYEMELPYPGALLPTFYRDYMLHDLNRALPVNGRIEKRRIPSWIITIYKNSSPPTLTKTEKLYSGKVYDNDIDMNYLEGMENMTVNEIINRLTSVSRSDVKFYYCSPPFFNETGLINERLNLKKMHLKYYKDKAYLMPLDLKEWKAAFNRNGLDINIEDREVEVMVLTKKETPSK